MSKLRAIQISDATYKNFANISGKGRIVLAASTESQVSQEWHEFEAGIFTHYLLEGLNLKADMNTNQKVDILELYNYVRDGVKKQTNGAQTPEFSGTLDQNIEF